MSGRAMEKFEWLDPEEHEIGWHDENDVREWGKEPPRKFRTLGWVIYENEDVVVVASSVDGHQVGSIHKLIKASIVKRGLLSNSFQACHAVNAIRTHTCRK